MTVKQTFLKRLHEAGIKLIAVGGYVTSFTDAQNHFVDANRVVELYQLTPKDCMRKTINYKPGHNEIILRPRDDADYDLLKRIQEFYLNKQKRIDHV